MLHYNGNTLGNHGEPRESAAPDLTQFLVVNDATTENTDLVVTAHNTSQAGKLYSDYWTNLEWDLSEGLSLRFIRLPDKATTPTAHPWIHEE